MRTLYEKIIDLCKSRGITGGKMCTDIGISKSTLTDLKSGRKKTINLTTADKIADYFGVSVAEFMADSITLDHVLYITAKDNGMNAGAKLVAERIEEKEKTAGQKADGSRGIGKYDELTPENRKMIDALIDSLLKSQSGE